MPGVPQKGAEGVGRTWYLGSMISPSTGGRHLSRLLDLDREELESKRSLSAWGMLGLERWAGQKLGKGILDKDVSISSGFKFSSGWHVWGKGSWGKSSPAEDAGNREVGASSHTVINRTTLTRELSGMVGC